MFIIDKEEYISFRTVFAIKSELSKLGFSIKASLNAHSFALHSLSSSLSLPPFIPPSNALMSGWASSKGIHYRNTELIPPHSISCFPSSVRPAFTCSLNPTHFLFFSLLYSGEQDKPQQGAGSWKTLERRQPFLSSSGEKQLIYLDPQYNFLQNLTRRASFFMNNKQSFAQGKEAHTDSFPSLCFLTLDLQATSESPTEFIANF